MFILNDDEIQCVSGGDAAATRPPGTNSWGETPAGAAYNNSGPIRRIFDRMVDHILRI